MSFNVFRNGAWDLAQRLRVFRTVVNGVTVNDWYLAKKISAWRGADPGGYWQVVYPDPPAGVVTPNTSGTPIPSYSLSASNYFVWDYSDYRTPDTVAYQWQESQDDITYTNISGATNTTYTVQDGDIGYYIRLRFTGTNERASTEVFSNKTIKIPDPYYTFSFGNTLGVNANAQIFMDTTISASHLDSVPGRVLKYFLGDFKHFRTWYKSDTTTFRIYHQMYRNDRTTRPASPDLEYEIVFTDGSRVVDIFVANAVLTDYIIDYTAWEVENYELKSHPSASYAVDRRFRVAMDPTTLVSAATALPSTTSPSNAAGWIDINSFADTTTGTITFNSGGTSSSPILAGVNGAFTKSNMFFPTQPTVNAPVYVSTTTATVSWSGSNANGYYIAATRTTGGQVDYWAFLTGTSTTMTGLSTEVAYTVTVSPISRSTFDGQYGSAGTASYTHVAAPSAVQSLSASSPTQTAVAAGSSGGVVTWTISWTAPATGAPIIRYEYDLDIDADDSDFFAYDDVWQSNGTSASFSISALSGIQLKLKVRAVNAGGAGPATELYVNSSPSTPGTPTFSTPAINSTNAQATINWTASSAEGGSSLSYVVYRGQNETGAIDNARSSVQTSTSYSDNISGGATTFYYRVVPRNTLGGNLTAIGLRSAVSGALNVTQPSVNKPTVSGSNTSLAIGVNWSGNVGSGNTLNYSVYRGQVAANMGAVGSGNIRTNSAQTSTSFNTDTGTAGISGYFYRVDGQNNIDTVASPVSDELSTYPGAPGKPAVNAQNNTNNNLTIGWSAATNNLTGALSYRVFRSQNQTTWNDVTTNNGTVNNTNRNFADSYSGTATFYYKVAATNVYTGNTGGTESPISNPITAA